MVYVNDKINLFIEEIVRDAGFWSKMLPTLITFYRECIAPEIVRNFIDKGKRCKDPPSIRYAIAALEEKKLKKAQKRNNSRMLGNEISRDTTVRETRMQGM